MISFRSLVFATWLSAGVVCSQLVATSAGAEPAVATATPAKTLLPTDLTGLRAEMGKKVIVEGTLVLAGESKSGTVRYLNFTKNWRESISLVFFVGTGDEAFSLEKLRSCVGRKVRATGVVSEYESNLQLQIDSWKQVQALR